MDAAGPHPAPTAPAGQTQQSERSWLISLTCHALPLDYASIMSENAWPRVAGLSDDPDEVFACIDLILGGQHSRFRGRAALGTPPKLEVGYTNSGNPFIRELAAGPIDWDGLREQITNMLRSEPSWVTSTMFCQSESIGAVHTQHLQIRPAANLEAIPRGWQGVRLGAFLVDVRYPKPSDGMIDARRTQVALREAFDLLSVTTWPAAWLPSHRPVWTILGPPTTEKMTNSRVYLGFQPEEPLADGPSAPSIDGHEQGRTIPHEQFTRGRVDLLGDGVQYTIDSLPELHAGLISMPFGLRQRARRALAWMADANGSDSPSVKIMCSVQAIEALLPPHKAATCECCGQKIYGLGKRVSGFLDLYAGSELREQFRKEIYGLRSRLTHGLKHYAVDETLPSPLATQDIDGLGVWTASHAAVLNWLLAQARLAHA